ncbi:MAG TPA: hypothetical protein VLJ15_00765 [Gammaproteobacteria bacterium]|nr:hypothetical protein [Gammaproteobacteria bacterium]
MTTHTPAGKSNLIFAQIHGTAVKNEKVGAKAVKQLDGRLGKIYTHLRKAQLEAALIGKNDSKDLDFLKKGVKALDQNLGNLAEHVKNLRQNSSDTLKARQSATPTKTTRPASTPSRRPGQ